MPYIEPSKPDINSKSQRKRDMLALQKLGESLLTLTETQWKELQLPDLLITALREAKTFKAEAKRRQMQYIGKLMRECDPEPIQQALKKIQFAKTVANKRFHAAEAWREKLIAKGDDAINAFIQDYPHADRQQLRQLVRKAQQEHKSQHNRGAEKALFQFLRSLIQE